jgi:hypothetical protein
LQIRLREDDAAGVAEPFDEERVFRGNRFGERLRPRRGRHVVGVLIVLQDNRDAVERSDEPLRFEAFVEFRRPPGRVVVHRQYRVQVVVERLNAGQVAIDERLGGELSRLERRVDVLDGRFKQVERVGISRRSHGSRTSICRGYNNLCQDASDSSTISTLVCVSK